MRATGGPEPRVVPPGASPRLHNADLAPVRPQTWTWYNIFAFWMSDVHSVGGYLFAASLFAFGLAGWQVLVCLLAGICLVQFFVNLIARPSQRTGVPFPVVCRMAFGVFGAALPAVTRGLIATVWYGIQTYLASAALVVLLLRLAPGLEPLLRPSFLGLSALGWLAFGAMWLLQALVFWHGMEAIRRFIDWAGPAVYAVMFLLAGWMTWQAGLGGLDFSLGSEALSGRAAAWKMLVATALVAGYFAAPALNFGDFARYCRSEAEVRRGNFWGLPVNFLAFACVTVVTVAGTLPVLGERLVDPIEMVARLDHTGAVLLGAFTFVTATIGINIVANFVAPAFDFANLDPGRISWRTGGMIAAVGSVFLTPWNLFANPAVIHYTVDVLAGLIGPIFGVLLVDYYLVRNEEIDMDALFSEDPEGPYWYRRGWNPRAVAAVAPATVLALGLAFAPGVGDWKSFALFAGGGLSALIYAASSPRSSRRPEGAPGKPSPRR